MKKSTLFILPVIFLFIPNQLLAQNEVERERLSLQGLQEFGFTANIEGSRDVADSEELTPSVIRQQSVNRLIESGIRYVSDEEVRSSADIPFLYMHINTMQLENGLVPFSIQLRLYQPVKLSLNRDLQTSASTWENGMVGIVSYDRLATINRAADDLLQDFIDDYKRANPGLR
ncbi:hypothetical protein [Rhodohalobacter mucosus]|uniref:Uncharacterized protein n=1 Tax=Rhodohalobacter mucosus TaxID=2079485 RepID=A0A316TMG3_9BACT|nr:hypothetical protein [Rhodohalobacter mucosus]PWN05787.1 hypothetical protein DDZ15_11360 [Rhodohalobacter mucosus]